MQILKACTNPNYGWQNHPAVAMWCGFETCLEVYMNLCIQEWIRRGFKNTMLLCAYENLDIDYTFLDNRCQLYKLFQNELNFYPHWFGNLAFHDSHKSNLLRKDYNYYSRYNWNVPNDLSYIWPTKDLT